MSNVLRLAIVDPNDATPRSAQDDAVGHGHDLAGGRVFAVRVLRRRGRARPIPTSALIGIDADPQKALELIHNLRRTAPECSILVVSSCNDGQLILQAMRAGAKEFLTQPVRIEDCAGAGADRRTAVGRRRRAARAAAGDRRGRRHRRRGHHQPGREPGLRPGPDDRNSVALVDLDLCLGDADVFLDTIPDYTWSTWPRTSRGWTSRC